MTQTKHNYPTAGRPRVAGSKKHQTLGVSLPPDLIEFVGLQVFRYGSKSNVVKEALLMLKERHP